jgi:subtilisin
MDATTGRSLVLFEDGATAAGIDAVQVFEALGVAVVEGPPAQLEQAGASAAIIAVEAERVVYALEVTPGPIEEAAPVDVDESEATWGLQATKVIDSSRTGRGIRVAVLDTGIDQQHPDFEGRSITVNSFVNGEEVQDDYGHGTHCIGTALGPRAPEVKPRYGIAYEAEIFAGKVLSNAGSGADAGILAGIEWAIENGCAVVSMSLGAPTQPGQPFSQVFERVAQRAQEQGTLIVAAAGNDSERPDVIDPVGHPANCPSIMAVAALDAEGAIAPFSNRGIDPEGGQVDIAGPGVAVYSSWPMPTRYRTISGTSMATPHVAGIAALYAEQDENARGADLWRLLTAGAQPLSLPPEDVGAGMVQAP